MRNLSDREIETFEREGVIPVRNAVDQQWVARMLAVVDQQLDNPSPWANDGNAGASNNRMFTDRYLWKENAEIRAYIEESGVARLAAQATRSEQVRFYFDHLLVKEPGTAVPTPWHQDIPYWPFLGRQICSVWLALTNTSVQNSAMEFVRGSHADGKYYMPEVFGDRENHPNNWAREGSGDRVPAIESDRDQYDIVGWDVSAGDAVLFSAWTLHWAPGNASTEKRRAAISTRWLGDDASWFPHEGADPTVTQDQVSLDRGGPINDDEVFPVIWRV